MYSDDSSERGGLEICTGVVVYEDAFDRDRVLRLYDRLANHFNEDLEFEFEWWRCKYLVDPELTRQAGEAANKADLIVLSFRRIEEVPLEAKAWIERWLLKRPPAPGALVVMPGSQDAPEAAGSNDAYLRGIAQRAHLDYLPLIGVGPAAGTGVPGKGLPLVPPGSAASVRSAGRQPRSSRHGINE